jgi:hypothetical protein
MFDCWIHRHRAALPPGGVERGKIAKRGTCGGDQLVASLTLVEPQWCDDLMAQPPTEFDRPGPSRHHSLQSSFTSYEKSQSAAGPPHHADPRIGPDMTPRTDIAGRSPGPAREWASSPGNEDSTKSMQECAMSLLLLMPAALGFEFAGRHASVEWRSALISGEE